MRESVTVMHGNGWKIEAWNYVVTIGVYKRGDGNE